MELAYFLLASAIASCVVGGRLIYIHGIRRIGNFRPSEGLIPAGPQHKAGKGRLGLNLVVAGVMLLMLAYTVCSAS